MDHSQKIRFGQAEQYLSATSTNLDISGIRDITYTTTNTNSTAGDHIFKIYGTEVLRIRGSTNRVGIGEVAPAAKLHVNRGGQSAVSDNDDTLLISDKSFSFSVTSKYLGYIFL